MVNWGWLVSFKRKQSDPKYCPDCGGPLSPGAKHCRCGYKITPKESEISDKYCHYSLSGQRCPAIGTISPNAFSKKWYCRWHFKALNDNDAKLCAEILAEFTTKGMPEDKDWLEELKKERGI